MRAYDNQGADSVISTSGIEKSFKQLKVLDGLDLNVQKGTVFAMLGQNGAGKTTTIRILSTLLKPDAGQATILGYDVVKQPEEVRNLLSAGLVIGVALLIGFRPSAGPLAWLAALGIVVLYILAISWLGVVVGLAAQSVEGASAFSFFVLFLPYVSSAFVPTESMPKALHFIAENQPYTHVIETIRALTTGGPLGSHGWLALAWTGGITLVSYAIAVTLFKRKAAR